MQTQTVIEADEWLSIGRSLRLSGRELQIVQAIFDDQEPANIASADVMYRTLQRIYVKLRVGSRAELIVRVMVEHLAFVADQAHPEFYGLAYWPVKNANPHVEHVLRNIP